MGHDPEFELMLRDGFKLISVNVIYYLPDHHSLINTFFFQTMDLTPKYPRVHKFLNFWKTNIDAVIKEIEVDDGQLLHHRKWRNGNYYHLN